MNKITVTVPLKARKWKVSCVGSVGKQVATAAGVMRYVDGLLNSEKFLDSEAKLKEKTTVKVKYDDGYVNESLSSRSCKYLLYCLACFLEDYLSVTVIRQWESETNH